MKKLTLATLLLVAAFALAGCSNDNSPTAVTGAEKVRPDDRTTLKDVALAVNEETGEFSTLIAALVATGLDGVVDGVRPYTVFAPTDEAFAALDLNADNIGEMDPEVLTNILLYHVTNGRRAAVSIAHVRQIAMANGEFVAVTADVDGKVYVNDAEIVAVDVAADNGFIHVIDAVLLP
jgi:uncharacterized surface protein with fasciclin (FAS1) repeats